MGALAGNPDEPIPEGDETARLAILDLDWEHVTAVDILAVLRSFLGKVGVFLLCVRRRIHWPHHCASVYCIHVQQQRHEQYSL